MLRDKKLQAKAGRISPQILKHTTLGILCTYSRTWSQARQKLFFKIYILKYSRLKRTYSRRRRRGREKQALIRGGRGGERNILTNSAIVRRQVPIPLKANIWGWVVSVRIPGSANSYSQPSFIMFGHTLLHNTHGYILETVGGTRYR